MSGPNTNYDPVEVTPLGAEAVQAMVDEALAAFAAATTLADLKAARLAHAGDRSPLALANREIGALPPAATQGRRRSCGQGSGGDRSGACRS
jgi:phenylalanyl-tRNA synthetase alpha chain